MAWADIDLNGDLDLAIGNGEQVNQVYQYHNSDEGFKLAWESSAIAGTKSTQSVAWGDFDGDLDLAAGNADDVNVIYEHEGGVGLGLTDTSLPAGVQSSQSVAWGDFDLDGDLDVAVGNEGEANRIYQNEGQGAFSMAWQAPISNTTKSLAWGDMDGDGDLDLAVGNYEQANQIYRNDGGDFNLTWSSSLTDTTWTVAWGDVDGDGDLDLAVGNEQQANRLYRNENGDFSVAWNSPINADTRTIAWGDMDGDGNLDLAIGNHNQANQVYRNDGSRAFSVAWTAEEAKLTTSLAWGDMDSDGDLDLAIGNTGNEGALNEIYRNEGHLGFSLAWESYGEMKKTTSVAWGDMDADGDLDLAVGNWSEPNQLYRNDGNGSLTLSWNSVEDLRRTTTVAWGDMDSDGDLDLAVANDNQANQIFENFRQAGNRLPNNAPYLSITRPDGSADANFYASSAILSERTIPISYTLFDPEGETAGRIEAFYSLDGGGNWLPAIPTNETITTNLASAPYPITDTNTHLFTWDTFASHFFGQSNNVLLRFVVYPQPVNSAPNSYQYPKRAAGPYLWPYTAASTLPLRVRGTQVRVLSDTLPVKDAMIYRNYAKKQ